MEDIFKVHGTTFVQLPKPFENASCKAMGLALCETKAPGLDRQHAGWKAVFLLPLLLLSESADSDIHDSCASLLAECLQCFWLGDVVSICLETGALAKPRQKSARKPKQAVD